jgi:hypothetical protein
MSETERPVTVRKNRPENVKGQSVIDDEQTRKGQSPGDK